MLNEGNQIHNFISSSGSGSDFLTSYGSGSTRHKVTVPTVPVPQHCFAGQKLYFLCKKKLLQRLNEASSPLERTSSRT
jgi:hypothetical protein